MSLKCLDRGETLSAWCAAPYLFAYSGKNLVATEANVDRALTEFVI